MMTDKWHSFRLNKTKFNLKHLVSYKLRYNWDVSNAWRLVPDHYKYFSNKNNRYINGNVITIKSNNDIKSTAKGKGIKKGDLLYFRKKGKKDPYHAAIIVNVSKEKIYYSAHTKPRKEQDLSKSIGKDEVLIVKMK